MIRAVVFDLDHTLYDRYETLRLIVPLFREKFKINDNISNDYFWERIVWADRHFVHRGWGEIYGHLCEKNIFKEIPTYEEYESFLLSCFKKIAVEFPFAIPTIKRLHETGLKVGLITNGKPEVQEKKIKMLNLESCFDEIIISGACDYDKPQPEIFKLMANKLGVDTAEMMYVGDHPHYDVEGSRNAGCVPVWVKTTGTWIFPEFEKPEFQVETVEEIPDIIKILQ